MTTSRAGQVLDAGLILADAAAVTVPAMREMIDQQPPGMRRLIGYQLGWWDTDGARIEGRQGKTLRPALSLLSCQAVGGVVDQAIPAAVAVELLHNGMLVHDDIIDEDELRRGRPTLWKVYGVPTAILVGDVLFLLPAQVLVRAHAPLCIQGPDRLVSALQISMDGGVTEILLEQRATATFAEVTQVIAAKTSALMAASCALGAVAAGADPDRIDHFHAFGHHLGTAFQIADDLLGIWGEPVRTGKPVHSDLHSRKKSLPVVAALTADHPAGRALAELYADPRPLDAIRAARLIEEAGGRVFARQQADQHVRAARAALADAAPAPSAAAKLTTLLHFGAHRDH